LLVAAVAAAASRASVRMGIGSAGLHGGSRGRRRRSRPVAVVGGEAMVKDEAGADEIWSDHHVWLVSALERLNFDNTAVRRLLVDPTEGGPVRQVHGSHMVRVRPSPLKSPELMATSDALLLLGLPLDMVEELAEPGLLPATVRAELSAYFAGNRLPAGADPCAAAYCGHQFGRFAGQLGDGAVISLGEIVVREDADEQAQPLSGNDGAMPARTRAGGARGGAREGLREEPPARAAVRQREDAGSDDGAGGAAAVRIAPLPTDARGRWEVQLKGAGQTPFSRAADGRKVLRSTVREFLASEAMAALGVPTTRAAALVVSESRVTRDAKGKGQTREERCAVLTRVGRSFLRFGSFELCLSDVDGRSGPSANLNEEVLAPLLAHAVDLHYPHLASLPTRPARAAAFLVETASRTGRLVAAWQAFGFVHGVLNTDNLAVSGDTIDYGPFGFMDVYDPDYVPNNSDAAGRYSYRQQPVVCEWNVRRLAHSLGPLLEGGQPAAEAAAVKAFWAEYKADYRRRFRDKLGLLVADEGAADDRLLSWLLDVMQISGADYTNVFRCLSRIEWEASEAACYRPPQAFDAVLEYCLAQCASCEAMLKRAKPLFHPKALARLVEMEHAQPEKLAKFGLDASVVQREVTRAARRDQLSAVTPRDKRLSDADAWRSWLHAYRLRLFRERCAVLGVGGDAPPAEIDPARGAALQAAAVRRKGAMNGANPRFILRQHIAARVIERAEGNEWTELARVQRLLRRPFSEQGHTMNELYAALPPDWSHSLVFT